MENGKGEDGRLPPSGLLGVRGGICAMCATPASIAVASLAASIDVLLFDFFERDFTDDGKTTKK